MLRSSMLGSEALYVSLCLFAYAGVGHAELLVPVIPYPETIVVREGSFVLTPKTCILVTKETESLGQQLGGLVRPATGFDLPLVWSAGTSAPETSILKLAIEADDTLGEEGYRLQVTPNAVDLSAPTQAGLFYGIQTLRQLLPPEIETPTVVTNVEWKIPAVEIRDKPRFTWRGMHLDVGRHLFDVAFIKKYIDLLALHKMNIFHWHLTEDQGWRIEIKKYPRLTEVGSKRSGTNQDNTPYGGYYTQAQIKDIVAYAAERFITVVPEIELPGHSVAALASYPNLGCTGGPYEVRRTWGVANDVYCAGNEEVYTFLENVLTEVVELFPSRIIHIGGDECPKVRWKACPKCQAMIKRESLHNENELQSYFIKRVATFLKSKGRDIIGWDEILDGGLAPGAAVMSWRGTGGGVKAASMGHDVVMSPTSHCYFDYPAQRISVAQVYAFEPVPNGLAPDKVKHVLGAQGNVWTERMPTSRRVETMAFPRASALAEVLWSAPESRDYEQFTKRLPFLLARLRALDVNVGNP